MEALGWIFIFFYVVNGFIKVACMSRSLQKELKTKGFWHSISWGLMAFLFWFLFGILATISLEDHDHKEKDEEYDGGQAA